MISSFRQFIGPRDYGYHTVSNDGAVADEGMLRPPAEGDVIWHDGMGNWFHYDRDAGALSDRVVVSEDGAAPTTVVGTGHIAGASPGELPPVSKKRQSMYRMAGQAMARRKLGPLLGQ